MAAATTSSLKSTPKTKRRPVAWTGRQLAKGGKFAQRRYIQGRNATGSAWAIAPPAALAGAEYLAHEELPELHDSIPSIEAAGATDDMIIASAGAAALGGVLTLAAKGAGLDVERVGVKRGIEATSAAVATATDLLVKVQVSGTEISHNPVVTWASGIVALGFAALGGIAGASSGRAIAR